MKMLVEPEISEDMFWAIFVYASTENKERERQWELLQLRKQH